MYYVKLPLIFFSYKHFQKAKYNSIQYGIITTGIKKILFEKV